jgi:hypothetical protein
MTNKLLRRHIGDITQRGIDSEASELKPRPKWLSHEYKPTIPLVLILCIGMQNVDSSVLRSRLTPSTYSTLRPTMYSLLPSNCVNDLLCCNGTMMRTVFDEPGAIR